MWPNPLEIADLVTSKEILDRKLHFLGTGESMKAKLCFIPRSINIVADFISYKIQKIRKFNIASSCR